MLEYCKTILSKVSFDGKLFEKELKKAIKKLATQELEHLRQWCYEKFSHLYLSILNQNFSVQAR